ncbi:MAG: hypothetical protein ACFE9Z_10400 [Promethearchaeota archaeon]
MASVRPTIIINPHSQPTAEGKNQTPITKTRAYSNANKEVIASPEANLNPIIFHL